MGTAAERAMSRGIRMVALLFLVAVLWDFARLAEDQASARVLIAGIHLYQETVSSQLPQLGIRCRFIPTCSHYAEEVIRRHGALQGSWRAVKRLLRCGPWTPQGTVDLP